MEILKHIHDLNLSSLILAQSIVKQDRDMAIFRMGISESMADLLEEMTLDQMVKLSETNQFICHLRFDDYQTLQKQAQESQVDDVKHIHTDVLLSSSLLQSLTKINTEKAEF